MCSVVILASECNSSLLTVLVGISPWPNTRQASDDNVNDDARIDNIHVYAEPHQLLSRSLDNRMHAQVKRHTQDLCELF